jgi:4,5:9,10-diseco-3-hydroxy-5,9,17-trioxoandrosta-1(10),2-diene-4-oate hydrolase
LTKKLKIQNKRVKLGNISVNYHICGKGSPLIMVHGGGQGAETWLKTAIDLSGHYTVYVPDLPGFGKTASLGDEFVMARYVGFLEEFRVSQKIDTFHLVGHSLGGAIALHYALDYPDRINKMVLVSSFCLGKEMAFWLRFFNRPNIARYLGLVVLALLRIIRLAISPLWEPMRYFQPITKLKINIGQSFINRHGQALVLTDRLKYLKTPTLLVSGKKDPVVPVSHAINASRIIPNCRLHVSSKGGHAVHKQMAMAFCTLLVNFLG